MSARAGVSDLLTPPLYPDKREALELAGRHVQRVSLEVSYRVAVRRVAGPAAKCASSLAAPEWYKAVDRGLTSKRYRVPLWSREGYEGERVLVCTGPAVHVGPAERGSNVVAWVRARPERGLGLARGAVIIDELAVLTLLMLRREGGMAAGQLSAQSGLDLASIGRLAAMLGEALYVCQASDGCLRPTADGVDLLVRLGLEPPMSGRS